MDKQSPTSPIVTEAFDKETEQLLITSKRLTKINYILTILSQFFTFVIQSVHLSLLANNRIGAAASAAKCLQQYYNTNTGQNWSPTTIVWPTILNTIAALIIVIWSGILLLSYCFRGGVEKRLAKYSPWASVIQSTLTAFATGIMLGTASNPNSLEGQTCSNTPPTAVDSNAFCFRQVRYDTLDEDGNCRTFSKW